MKTLLNVRWSSWLLLAGLCAGCRLAARLPAAWGWENGPLENVQAMTLLAGLALACLAAWQQRDMAAGKIWCIAMLFWLDMLGRELAWGAVFLPPLQMHADSGPLYSAHGLWWQPAVAWVCAAMLLLGLYWVARFHLLQAVVLRWLRERAMPWGCLLVFGVAMALAALAANHASGFSVPGEPAALVVLEEMAQCWAYVALWWGQWQLVQHMQAWRASSYLQTLHFSLNSLREGFEHRSI